MSVRPDPTWGHAYVGTVTQRVDLSSPIFMHMRLHLHSHWHVHQRSTWLVVPVIRSCQSPIWIWLVIFLHLQLHEVDKQAHNAAPQDPLLPLGMIIALNSARTRDLSLPIYSSVHWLVAWGLCGCMLSRFSTVWLLPFTLLQLQFFCTLLELCCIHFHHRARRMHPQHQEPSGVCCICPRSVVGTCPNK